jgi:CRISPR-associated protein Csd1
MSVLQALATAYERLADRGEVPPFGYSNERIGFLIALAEDGMPAGPPIDLREGEGRKLSAPLMRVPQRIKRTSGVAPNFLWDNTSYSLGVTTDQEPRTPNRESACRFRRFSSPGNRR